MWSFRNNLKIPMFVRISIICVLFLVKWTILYAQIDFKADSTPVSNAKASKEILSNNVFKTYLSGGIGIPTGRFASNNPFRDRTGGANLGFAFDVHLSYHWASKLRKARKGLFGIRIPDLRNYQGIGIYIFRGFFPQDEKWIENLMSNGDLRYEYRTTFTGFDLSAIGLKYSLFQLNGDRFYFDINFGIGYCLVESGDYSVRVLQNGVQVNAYDMAFNQVKGALDLRRSFGLCYRVKRGTAIRFGVEFLTTSFRFTGDFNSYETWKQTEFLFYRSVDINSVNISIGLVSLLSK